MEMNFKEMVQVAPCGPLRVDTTHMIVPQHEIVEFFAKPSSKNQVVEGFLRFGSACFSNLAVFSVFSRSIQFLKGVGENIKDNPYLGVVDIDVNTIVRRSITSKFPYRGPIPVGMDEKALFSKFFSQYAEEVFLYPANIRSLGADLLFYADGPRAEREKSVATFEYVIEKSILALKLLWVQKQLTSI